MHKKIIAIITHPLQYNYGGLLQAYALSTVLKQYSDDVIVLRHSDASLKDYIKKLIEKISLFHKFKRTNINEKSFIYVDLEHKLQKQGVNTIVIGSDQVWRREFALNNFTFGQFLSDKSAMNIWAYGASFGKDIWEYTPDETKLITNLIKKFNGVSVRELSGIELCKKYIGIDAKWVLDPTMLLVKNDYLKFITTKSSKNIFVYLLDYENHFNQKMIQKTKEIYKRPIEKTFLIKNKFFKRITPTLSVQGWLSKIYNSELVLTDSFHGCVFCIILNKPFFVLENEKGGNTRIESLLNCFNLKNRIVKNDEDINRNLKIDWDSVNNIMNKMRKDSLDYIYQMINMSHDKN